MKEKIILVVSILFGLMFINAGLNKFFNYIPVPNDIPVHLAKFMSAIMELGWLWPLLGTMEVVGGILFITNKFRALGAIIIFPMMVGILLTHIFVDRTTLPLATVLMAVNLWVIWENREKYLPMVR